MKSRKMGEEYPNEKPPRAVFKRLNCTRTILKSKEFTRSIFSGP